MATTKRRFLFRLVEHRSVVFDVEPYRSVQKIAIVTMKTVYSVEQSLFYTFTAAPKSHSTIPTERIRY